MRLAGIDRIPQHQPAQMIGLMADTGAPAVAHMTATLAIEHVVARLLTMQLDTTVTGVLQFKVDVMGRVAGHPGRMPGMTLVDYLAGQYLIAVTDRHRDMPGLAGHRHVFECQL